MLVPAAAGAHGAHYVEGRGGVWHHRENDHGAALRRGRIAIYLGRNCDVFSPQLGRGRWGWANGGVIVTAGARRLGFPRFDPPVQRVRTRCDVEHVSDDPRF
jgi:hypothetical protein